MTQEKLSINRIKSKVIVLLIRIVNNNQMTFPITRSDSEQDMVLVKENTSKDYLATRVIQHKIIHKKILLSNNKKLVPCKASMDLIKGEADPQSQRRRTKTNQ